MLLVQGRYPHHCVIDSSLYEVAILAHNIVVGALDAGSISFSHTVVDAPFVRGHHSQVIHHMICALVLSIQGRYDILTHVYTRLVLLIRGRYPHSQL